MTYTGPLGTVAGTRIPLPETIAGGTVGIMVMGATFWTPVINQKVLAKDLTLLALLAEDTYFMRDSRLLASHLSSHNDPTLLHYKQVPHSTSNVRFDAVHHGRERIPNSR